MKLSRSHSLELTIMFADTFIGMEKGQKQDRAHSCISTDIFMIPIGTTSVGNTGMGEDDTPSLVFVLFLSLYLQNAFLQVRC